MLRSNTSNSPTITPYQHARIATAAHIRNRFIQYAVIGTLTLATSFAVAAASPFAGQANPTHNPSAETPYQIRVFTGKNPNTSEMIQVTDIDGNGLIDSGDASLLLLNLSDDSTDVPSNNQSDIPTTDNSQSSTPALAGVTTFGMQGLHAKNYLVTDGATTYSVMDVYVRFGSAVGIGSAGERIVSVFGQTTTDTASGNVSKLAKYLNDKALAFQHSNISWLPAAGSNGGTGNTTWDSFVTLGCRNQGLTNTGGVLNDPYFANPNGPNVAALVNGINSSGLFPGAGWAQNNPLDAGFETNAGANADKLIMIGRFTLKVSDILALGAGVTPKLTVFCNTTGKSTPQSGGTTLYTIAAANLKSDATTTYTTSGQTWTFTSTFEGAGGQTPWTFATITEAAVSDLVATDATLSDRIQLTWTPLSGAPGYSVWRSENGVTYAQIATIATNTGLYDDLKANSNGPSDNTLYYYKVRSTSPTATLFSNVDTGSTSISAPNNVLASSGTFTDKVKITWDAVSVATAYDIFRNASATKLGSVDGFTTTYNDITAVPGAAYSYTVKALSGNVSSGTTAASIGYRALATPTPPTASEGSYVGAGVEVTWSTVIGATGYDVYRDSEATKIGSPAGTTLKFIDSTASITESHTYRIKAIATTASTGTVVASPFSGTSNAGWIGITYPTYVLATYATFADKVVVSWDAVPGAIGYRLYRGGTVGTGGIIGNVSASELSFNDTTVGVAAQFTYSVAAINELGAGYAKSSAVGAGIRNISPPSNVAASVSTFTDKIQVTWTAAPSATGYDIYRNDSAVKIGSTSGNGSITFDDISALSATNYSYFVCSTNSGYKLVSAASASVAGLRGAVVPTPTITSVNPNTGVLAGATTITITGTNLANASSVTVGGVTATGLVLISPTQVSAVTPASATAGAKAVAVITPGGTATAAGAFTYTDATLPSIALISPLSGPTSGGTPLTITGTNLIGATVTIGGNPVTSPTVTATQITALIPAGIAGVQNVVVTVAGVVVGGSATSNAFTYVAQPTISSITPNTGLTTGSTLVTINGTNLLGASVTVNDKQATLQSNSATQVTILTPVSAVGSVALVLTTAGGSASATYIYAAVPTIVSNGITPNVGATTGGTTVTIDGTNFTNATGVTFGGVTATGFVYVSATRVIATSPAGTLGAKDVVVVIPSGSVTSTGGFTYTNAVLPTLTFVSPSSGSTLGATVVTLTGTNFTGATSVTVGGVAATSFQVMSATSIVVVTPTGSIGDKDIVVVTPSGSATKTAAFEYVDLSLPTISTVSPTFGPTAGGTEIVIIGTNLTGATSVTIGGVAASSFAVGSATSMTAVTGVSATAGVKDVVVTTPVGVATKSGSFSYQEPVIPAPTISAVSPVSGSVGGGTTITITGTNLTGATVVTVDGVEATSLIVASSTSMSAVTPAGTAGSKSVAVTTPGGTATKQIAFTYNTTLPTILTVSPSSGPLVGDTLITVTGTNLANVISLTINGYETTSLVATATSITARTPVGTAGAKTMFLTTSVGTTLSYTNGYTYVSAPTISTVSPTFGPTAGGTEITITGTNLSTVTGVTVDGVAATSVVATTSSITALTPARSTGVKDIVVTTTGGAVTKAAAYTFTDAIPTITSVTPNQGLTAGGTEVVIVGTNLADTTSVKFGTLEGIIADSTSTQITVLTPAVAASVKDVVVTNNNGTATKSAAFTFYASSALPTISSVSPTSGIVLGGTSVTITGTLMANTTGVKVGGVAASFVVNSSTSVTIVTPAGIASGATTIVVTTPSGSSVGKAFTYNDFTISPELGPTSGGTPITITGTQLTGATSLTIGGVPVTGLVVVSSTKIVALTPAGSTGTRDVVLTIPAGIITKPALYQYTDIPPTVTTVAPNVGVKAGGTTIVINGTNFQTLGTTTVTVGGTAATAVVVNSSTQITAKTPIGTVGAQPVTVSSFNGSGTSNDAFNYYGIPTIASTGTPVSPVSGPTSGGTVLTITGTNFIGATSVTVGGANATLVSVTDTVITAITPTGTVGAQTIVVTSPGGVATKTAAFTFVAAPTITSVTPTSGPTTGGTTITIAGTNFTGATSVTVGGVAVSFFSVASATSITANTNASGAGLKDIVVTTPGGSVTKSGAFTFVVPAPLIDSVDPSSGPINGGTSIVINGTGFSGVTSVLVGGSVANISAVNALQITAVTPAGALGAKDVVVNTPAGPGTKVGAFTYVALQAPTIASVSPNSGPTGGGTSFTIVGTNLTGASSVTIGGAAAPGLTVVNSTMLTATTPSGTVGAKNVVVTTPSGSATATAAFTYNTIGEPTIGSVSPPSGPTDGGTTITIAGTNLLGVSSLKVGGVTATVLTNTATKITATTPAGTAGAAKDVVVVATGGTVTASGAFTYVAAPTITTIAPSSGSAAGGTEITITGTNLTSASSVTVGGASATVLTNSATVITATTPIGTAGAQNVLVTTVGGTATKTGGFTYIAVPTITTVAPVLGPIAGATTITITGTSLTGASSVTVGGVAATSVAVVSATSVTAVTGASTAGLKDVVLTTPGGSVTKTGAFTYVAAPTITTVSPTSGSALGGTTITITGTNLTGASSVVVGGVAATSVAVVSAISVTAITGAGTAGLKDVVLTTPGGSVTKTGAFTYVAAPTITTVAPTSGSSAGGTTITITGTNLTGTSSVTVGGTAATSVSVVSATSVTAVTPAGTAGAKDVVLTTLGGSVTKSGAFTFEGTPVPTISGITPTSGPTSGGTTITITGTGFTAATSVKFGNAAAASFAVTSATKITAVTPAGTVGAPLDVSVTTAGGVGTLPSAFTYTPMPTIISVSPNSGSTLGATAITITGTNLTGATSLTIGGVATTFTVVSSTTITAVTPAGTAGPAKDIVVITAGGTTTKFAAFTYIALPTITKVAPSSGPTGGATTITITGTNLTGTSSVTVGGTAATSVAVVNDTSVTALTPIGTTGVKDVVLTTPNGSDTELSAFTYVAAPTITTIAPSSGSAAGGTTITITGTNLTGATVLVAGKPASSVVVSSATSMTAVTPAGTEGSQNVDVTTAGGTATKAGGFTYIAVPTITTVAPVLGPIAGATTITITGTNLTGASSVTVGGVAATSVAVVSSTSVTAVTGASPAGLKDVVLTTPGGSVTKSGAFTYVAAPTVSSVTPTSGPLDGGTRLVIVGTGFVTGATVVLIDSVFECTNVNVLGPTLLQATTPSGTAGSKTVQVRTAGGTVTALSTFSYLAMPTITSVQPNFGVLAGGTPITITGTNLTGATVTIGGASATGVTSSATSISAITPSGVEGKTTVVVTTAGGVVSQVNGFEYTNVLIPTISSVFPLLGPVAGGTEITITGTNLTGASSVTVGGVAATSVVVNGAGTSVTATTSAGSVGLKDVVVTTPVRTATLSNSYTYVGEPTIDIVSPSTGLPEGGTAITITGTNLTGTSSVTVGGVAATSVVVSSATSVTAVTGAATAGVKNVVVTTPGGSATKVGAFTYVSNSPTISSVVPNSGIFNGGTAITITGTNFTGASSVMVGGVAATSMVVVSATTVSAVTPAGNAGAQSVSVTTPIGMAVKESGFEYVVPAPLGVSATDGTSTAFVTVTWSAVVGVKGYDVFRNGGSTKIGSSVGTATTFNDETAVAGTLYTYTVKAITTTGSSPASASDTGWRKLSAPLNVICSTNKVPPQVFATQVQISWDAVVGAISYDIFRDGSATKIGSATVTTYSDTEAPVGVNLTYTVRAVGILGSSDLSAGAIGWRAPTAPTNVVASKGTSSTKVTVTWSAVAAATSYDIFRDGAPTKIGSSVGTATTYADTTALAATTHKYTVKSVTAAGSSEASAADTGYVLLASPLLFAATDGASFAHVALSWSSVLGATGYNIIRNDLPSTNLATTSGNTSTTFVDTTAVIGKIYSYSVIATVSDVLFNSAPSIDSGHRAIEVPTGVVASDGSWTSKISVSWTKVTGAVGYLVLRDGAATPIATLSGIDTIVFADTGTSAETTYSYTIKAQGIDVLSDASQADTGLRAATAVIVQDVSASDGTYTQKVAVTWSPSPRALGYQVFRSGLAGPLDTVMGNASTSYNDFTAKIGVSYTYYVKAFTIAPSQISMDAGGLSVTSVNDPGFRAPSAPTNVVATDGIHSDKVVITWDELTTVSGYQIFRDGAYIGMTGLDTTTTYSDYSAAVLQVYAYTVKAVTDTGLSALSNSDTGFRSLPAGPVGVAASDGTFSDKVQVTWTKLVGSTAYQIFRDGALVGTTTGYSSNLFNDTTALVGPVYTYTVKGVFYGGITAASAGNTGFRRASLTDGGDGSAPSANSTAGAFGAHQSGDMGGGQTGNDLSADSTQGGGQTGDSIGDSDSDVPTVARMKCDELFFDLSQRMEQSASFAAAIAPQLGADDDLDGVMDICQRNQGDMNLDGLVDNDDLVAMMRAFQAQDDIADINLDGEIDGGDLSLFLLALEDQAEQAALVGDSAIEAVVGEMDQVNKNSTSDVLIRGSNSEPN